MEKIRKELKKVHPLIRIAIYALVLCLGMSYYFQFFGLLQAAGFLIGFLIADYFIQKPRIK